MNTDYYTNLQSEDELRIEQRVLFNYYFECLDMTSKQDVYSCNFKQDDWDTRIVNLSQKTIYRFSFPDFTKDNKNLDKLRRCFSILQDNDLASVLSTGICENQFWYKRKLFHCKDVLSDVFESESNVNIFLDVLIDVLNNIKLLWEQDVYHGNISLDNIVRDGRKWFLVDPMFSFISLHQRMPEYEDDLQQLKDLIKKIANNKNCYLLDSVIDGLSRNNVSLVISKINEIKRTLYAPMSSGVLIKKPSYESTKPDSYDSGRIITNKNIENNNNYYYDNNNINRNGDNNRLYNQNNSSNKLLFYICIFVVLITFAFYNKDKFKNFGFGRDSEKLLEYEYSWNTNQPVVMREVLHQALNGDVLAQSTIINAAFDSEKSSSYVDSIILKTIFNPLWENNLTEDDRYTALRLGLSKLVTFEEKKVPLKRLSDLHPSVALAVAGSVSLDASNNQLKDVTLDYMSSLNGYYGNAYKKLSILGVKNLNELASKALSSIFVIGASEENITGFLIDSISDPVILRGKIFILLDLVNQRLIKIDNLYEIINKYFRKSISSFMDFFNTKDWKDIDKLDMLDLVVGKMPKKQLELFQYIDLLSYPLVDVRKNVAQVLKSSKKFNNDMLDFIADGKSKLSREQVYILMSLFLISGDEQHAVIDRFLATKPDDMSLLTLLLFRNNESSDDLFNFEVSRYLSHEALNLTKDQVWQLVKHSEPMARAIGYSNLDLNNPKEKAFLEEKRKTEDSDLLKVLIAKRLEE